MAIKLSRQLEAAIVAYLIDQRDEQGNTALAPLAILEGHRSETRNINGQTPEESTNTLVVTATRPRRWLESGGHYELQVQFRQESQADDVTLSAHDRVVQEIEDLFSPENADTVVAWLNAYDSDAFGVVGFEMNDEGEAEARERDRHGDSLPFTFEAYYKAL